MTVTFSPIISLHVHMLSQTCMWWFCCQYLVSTFVPRYLLGIMTYPSYRFLLLVHCTGSSTFCLSCGHGGHSKHMMEWFSKYSTCPAGCDCSCLESSGWTWSYCLLWYLHTICIINYSYNNIINNYYDVVCGGWLYRLRRYLVVYTACKLWSEMQC